MEDSINLIYKHFLNSEGISTDSRKIKKNSIFFSLKGENFDECVFWTGELYYSGYCKKLVQFVFEFYYNFLHRISRI